ncbi:tetratricopeptide repeat protein, partial [Brevundimonas abyssalis]|uniref:tetratricopeptide repeat protein n=1 Tax=Brevundimonas abyssalis TaxID=1125965 RepID=UPI0035A25955
MRRRIGRHEAALDAYDRALKLGVRGPEEARLNRAVILSEDLHRPDEAEAELDKALKLNPRFAPAWLNLGNLHEDRGRRDPARAAYEQALALEPGNVLALARLAGVARASGPDDPLIGRLRAALKAI